MGSRIDLKGAAHGPAESARMLAAVPAELRFLLRRFNVHLVFGPMNGKSLLSLPETGPRLRVNAQLSLDEQREAIATEIQWLAENVGTPEKMRQYRQHFNRFMAEARAWSHGGPVPALTRAQQIDPDVTLEEVYREL